MPDSADFKTPGGMDLEARDRWFVQAIVASPAMFRRQVGGGSLYWLAARDHDGEYLDGSLAYTLTIPLPVPAQLFWSVTIYDAQTRSQVRAARTRRRCGHSSNSLRRTANRVRHTVFGPQPPDEAADRWLQTVAGREWFAYLRVYGPQAPAFDGSWRPGDFVSVG